MKFDYTGRHVDVTPALREFTEEKLRKLERLLDGPLDVHVVLGIEKHRHVAEIQVKSRTTVLSGTQETGDLYASIGEVADKLERQALKHKEKLHDHKHRKSPRDTEVSKAIRESDARYDALIRAAADVEGFARSGQARAIVAAGHDAEAVLSKLDAMLAETDPAKMPLGALVRLTNQTAMNGQATQLLEAAMTDLAGKPTRWMPELLEALGAA